MQARLEKMDRNQILEDLVGVQITKGFKSLGSLIDFMSYAHQSICKWAKIIGNHHGNGDLLLGHCTGPAEDEAGVKQEWKADSNVKSPQNLVLDWSGKEREREG